MPADRKQVEEAVERLRVDLDTHDRGGLSYAASDGENIALVNAEHLRLLLTDHAALLARAEAAERRLDHLRQRMAYWTSCALATVDGPKPRSRPQYDHNRFVSIAEKMVQDCRVNQVPWGLQGRLDDAYDAAHRLDGPVKAGGEG